MSWAENKLQTITVSSKKQKKHLFIFNIQDNEDKIMII